MSFGDHPHFGFDDFGFDDFGLDIGSEMGGTPIQPADTGTTPHNDPGGLDPFGLASFGFDPFGPAFIIAGEFGGATSCIKG